MTPYVIPFWSYRPAGDAAVLKNHLTGQERPVPAATVEALERAHAGTPPLPGDIPLLATATRLRIAFDDRPAAERWMAGRAERQPRDYPLVDQIELTNRCPYTCKMCPRTTSMDRALGDMPLDLFTTIVGQIAGRQDFVALHHFGESLLHRGLPEAVRIARALGVRTGLSCNPPSLRPSIARELLDAGVANLLLSLDSLDANVYRDIRGPAARFDLADTHVRELVALRNAGRYDTSITLQMISMHANDAEADAFLAYCADTGVDRGVVVRLGRWDFDDAYVATVGEPTSPGYTAPCSLPWQSVAVLWDGRVVPCCHDYNGAEVLGDLTTSSLDDVWRQAAAEAFREHNEKAAVCVSCAFSKTFREAQREREGFRAFHLDRGDGGETRREWINMDSAEWRDGRLWFDRFDVLA